MKPQSAAVLRLLEDHPEGVTQHDAIRDVGCYRLAARIADLRADGVRIEAESVTFDGHTFARYRLALDAQRSFGL
ncbi:MAG: helix-turn-helix domain-containing protein [Actinomycetes bacterium]